MNTENKQTPKEEILVPLDDIIMMMNHPDFYKSITNDKEICLRMRTKVISLCQNFAAARFKRLREEAKAKEEQEKQEE